ncbi:HotDog domain-containing protein [Lobosporangium transversale]|uniref:HotDog domain-containing protein n=1 Tax=Lobosporangium transversale TaxID=64571 RepID=A0A1Y2GSI0_9FUNG|nr:HotDog domain-containing protein [Lobosporangium transversale]ORZ21763.1 HotDog domain-containing protein [Lobosporangium transversale]|eukprot:XP_021883014.1 HotDog domain-containing protein [Lobosporangium transversale]
MPTTYAPDSAYDHTPVKAHEATTAATASTTGFASGTESQEENPLQKELEELEIVRAHVIDSENWRRITAYSNVSDEYRSHHLIAGTLRGANKLGVSPAMFRTLDQKQVISILHVGRDLCGHPSITHGGLLATILDEITAMNAIPNLPGKTGVTANLNINYRHPCIADQFIIAHSELSSLEGRKAFVKASLKTLDGTVLTDATALFIAPKTSLSQITEQLNQARASPKPNTPDAQA